MIATNTDCSAVLKMIPFRASLLAAGQNRTHLVAMLCMAGALTVAPSVQQPATSESCQTAEHTQELLAALKVRAS